MRYEKMKLAKNFVLIGIILIGVLLFILFVSDSFRYQYLYFDATSIKEKNIIFFALTILFLLAAIAIAMYLFYNPSLNFLHLIPRAACYFACVLLGALFLTLSLNRVTCSYTTEVSDYGKTKTHKFACIASTFIPSNSEYITGYKYFERGDCASEEIIALFNNDQTFLTEYKGINGYMFSTFLHNGWVCYTEKDENTITQIRVNTKERIIIYGRYILNNLLPPIAPKAVT